jgi:hypothetical protein
MPEGPKSLPGAGQDRSLKLVVWVTAEPHMAVRIILAAGTFASRLRTLFPPSSHQL